MLYEEIQANQGKERGGNKENQIRLIRFYFLNLYATKQYQILCYFYFFMFYIIFGFNCKWASYKDIRVYFSLESL
jgi:hypothetical protein